MSLTFNFEGRRVLITGGAGDLGRATAKKFLEAGASVVIVDKDEAALKEFVKAHPSVEAVQVDLMSWEETAAALAKIEPVHHLVNNAGIAGAAVPFLQIKPSDVDDVIGINFKAMINVSQVVAQGMIDRNLEGTIVNVSSIMSSIAYRRLTLYCTSKAAVSMLTKNMALELAPHNIRVNAIVPTFMATKMTMPDRGSTTTKTEEATSNSSDPDSVRKETAAAPQKLSKLMQTIVDRQIVKRLLTVDETADLILYLSSSASAMVVGEEIVIDGGLFAN